MTLLDEIEQTNVLIKEELDKWQKIGADPINIQINPFILDAYVNATVAFLVEKGLVDDEEFTLFFKRRLLDNLTNARETIAEPAIKEYHRQQIVNGLPNMDIPKNRPMH